MSAAQLEGRRPIEEALRAGRPLHKLMVLAGQREGPLRRLITQARAAGAVVHEVDRSTLDRLAAGRVHQGVIALVAAHAYSDLGAILERARERGEEPLLLVLDGIEDPQNLGALLRCADAAGAHGVIVPERRAVGLTPAAAKASAGAIEHVPVARVVNLARTLKELKEQGIWVVGAHQDGRSVYHQAALTGPIALVVGSEGRGVSKLIAQNCDLLVRLPMYGGVESLNAAVAGAVVLYEIRRQRDHKGI